MIQGPVMRCVLGIALSACSDRDPATALRNNIDQAGVTLEVSSAATRIGGRIAVAVRLDVGSEPVSGVQGVVVYDPALLRYVGQSVQGEAVAIVNAKPAARGELRFVVLNQSQSAGRVALFVFETKGSGYMTGLRYVHEMAAAAGVTGVRRLSVRSGGTITDGGLVVPNDAAILTVADWAARLSVLPALTSGVAARPGEYVLNLKYGDVDYSGVLDLFDFLAVANAAVGNEPIIVGTDGPTTDVDLVVAGNVSPTNTGGACGTEADGSRIVDLFDFIAIANRAVGNPESCAGNVIPGRGPLTTNVVVVPAGDVGAGTATWTKENVYRVEGTVRVHAP